MSINYTIKINPHLEQNLLKFVPHFHYTKKSRNIYKIIKTLEKIPNISPSSILISNKNELFNHLLFFSKVARANYQLGKKFDKTSKREYPINRCGISSRNIFLSLLEFGYFNTLYGHNFIYDHSYVLIPFVSKKENFKGVFLIEPTYKQLNKNGKDVMIFIKRGSFWDYRVKGYKENSNLYPSQICSQKTIRENLDKIGELERIIGSQNLAIGTDLILPKYFEKNPQKYLEEAFENPCKLDPYQLF